MTIERTGCIYYAYCYKSGKGYVGQTINFKGRQRKHESSPDCRALFHAIKKYGPDLFTWHIIESGIPMSDLGDRERFWIASLNTVAPNGYNLTHGGEGGGRMSDETKQKLSEARKGFRHTENSKRKMSEKQKGREPWNKGIPRSEETKSKLRKANLGKRHKQEAKDKLSRAFKGRTSPMKGRKWTSEQRERLRISRQRKLF